MQLGSETLGLRSSVGPNKRKHTKATPPCCIFAAADCAQFSGCNQRLVLCARLSRLHPDRKEELLAAAEVPEGPECRRLQHPGERDAEADYSPGQGDGDDGGPQAVGHWDELDTSVRKLYH